MYLRNSPLNEIRLSFWNSIFRIQSALGLGDNQIADFLLLSPKEFSRLRSQKRTPKAHCTYALCLRMGITFDAIATNDFDLKALSRHYYGDFSQLPERYLVNSFSKKRTVLGILDCIETMFGYSKRAMVLRNFQVNEKMLEDPDGAINLNLSMDIAEYFYKDNREKHLLLHFGGYSVQTNQSNIIGETLRRESRSISEAYQISIENLLPQYVEKNYEWKIRELKESKVHVAGYPNSHLRRAMLLDPEPHKRLCYVRAGFISGIPALVGRPSFNVKKLSCAADGDSSCLFEFSSPD